LTVDFQQS